MKVNVRFTFNRSPLKLMHRALEIGFKMIEEKTQLVSLQLTIGTHLAPLLEEKEQDFRWVTAMQDLWSMPNGLLIIQFWSWPLDQAALTILTVQLEPRPALP